MMLKKRNYESLTGQITMVGLLGLVLVGLLFVGCTSRPVNDRDHWLAIYIKSEAVEEVHASEVMDPFTLTLCEEGEDWIREEEFTALANAERELLVYTEVYRETTDADQRVLFVLDSESLGSINGWLYYHKDGVYYDEIYLNVLEAEGAFVVDIVRVKED